MVDEINSEKSCMYGVGMMMITTTHKKNFLNNCKCYITYKSEHFDTRSICKEKYMHQSNCYMTSFIVYLIKSFGFVH